MALLKGLMRFFGYFFHGLLALFLLAVSGMALSTGMHSLRLKMLPWTGESLTYWVFFGSIIGLLSVLLAIKRIVPALFFVWALLVLGLMVKGYIFSGYHFGGGDFRTALYLIAGGIISLLGAWFGLRRTPARG